MNYKPLGGLGAIKQAGFGLLVITGLLSASNSSRAAVTIDLPDLTLDPSIPSSLVIDLNTAVQNSGSDVPVTGLDLVVQIENGLSNGPKITDIDILLGTIFGAVANSGHTGFGDLGGQGTPPRGAGQVFDQATIINSGTVNIPSGASKLGRITFNITGIAPGVYSYGLQDTTQQPSQTFSTFYTTTGADLAPPDLQLSGGFLTVVPEPSHYAVMAGLGCFGWALFARRSKRN